jgi:Concanavalin A-like lectin/glucanases superfamily/Ig-like domain CHU_C associated
MKNLLLKAESKKLLNTINVFKILFVLITFSISVNSYSQAATATWALTSDGNAVTTGAINASSLAIGSGINSPTYNAITGVTTNGWANDSGVRLGDEYYEYKVTPTSGNLLTVNSITLHHSISANSWRAAAYYSYNNFVTSTQIGGNFTSSSTTPTLWSSTGLTLTVPSGGDFTIRVFAWESDGNNIKFRNKDVVISGTTCVIPTITGTTPGYNCGTGTVTLGATSAAGTINWYDVPTGGTSLGTGNSFTTPSISTNTTYYVDATNGCTILPRTAVIATISSVSTANAAGPNTICQSASPTAMALTGATVGGGATTGAWSIISGGGTLSSTAQTATPATVTYMPASNFTGTVTLRLTSNNGVGCAAATSDRTINVNMASTAIAGGTISVCQSAFPTAITLTGATVGDGATTGAWSIISGGGTLSSTAQTATPATVTYTPAANFSGTVTLRLTSDFGVGCTAATADRTINVNASTSITSTTPASRTGAGTLVLGATASIGTINWYDSLTSGILLGTGTSFTTPFISATTTYYAEAVNGVCSSNPRTAVIATIKYPEIEVQGNATIIVNGDTSPSTLDWTDFGTTNLTRTFTIRNIGNAALNIDDVIISGTNESEFTITTPPSATVAIGSSTTFTVTFTPIALGVRTATIAFSNNDTDENPFSFDIQGTGIEQEIDIQGNSISILNNDSTPTTADWTDFSNVAGTRTFTIRNTGNIELSVGAITFSGINASDFSVTTPPSPTVAAFSTTTFIVTFTPSAINNRNATIQITTNDANESNYNFAIRGFGIVPEIDIQGNAVSIPDSTVPAPSLTNWTDFGTTSATRIFTIYNNGNITLNIGAITITGTNATEFTISTPPSSTIAAFSSATFVVTFSPTAIGVRSARINMVNDDSNENPYNFNIQGTGTPREIDIEGFGLSITNGDAVTSVSDGTDFGPADINLGTVTRTFTIKNTGSLSLTISNPTITGLNASEFSISTNPGTLTIGAGSSTTFQVTFNPSGVFTRVAQINIVNNDSDENPYTFAIQGIGQMDNDGDGIENNADQDDDNDGITDLIECGTCISDVFTNGSFETPVISAASYAILPTSSVTGWQTSAEDFIEIWSSGFSSSSGGPVPAAVGNQFAELNANVPGILYQTFCLNGAGGTINWTIKHRGRAGSDTAYVKFGDNLANAIASTPIVTMVDGNTSWGTYSGTYNIPLGQTTIVLTFQAGPTASGSASVGNFIDDVQIIINQNCIDTDGDSIADLLDVDDENDGISDIEEAGFKQYSNNTSTMDKSSVATWIDANANGINDFIDTMISNGTYLIPDTDGDGVPNHLDLDSDNDSLFDVDESGLLNGDGDITGDGKGDGLDTEGDGLLNLYDNSVLFGSAFRAYAQDTDGNGIPNYLELDSNDDGINDIQTGLYASFDTNGDGIIDGSGDSDVDGILNVFDTNDAVKGSPRDLDRKLFLDFDGRNDYAEDATALGVLNNATMMAWIDLNATFSSNGVIVGVPNFQLKMDGGRYLQATVNGTTTAFNTRLNRTQWYHVATVYDGSILKLYLNGVLVNSIAATGSIPSSNLTLGKNPSASNMFFKGKIDEVRVFNVALTDAQVQRMVYQEIQNTASQVRGAIVPKDIEALPFANLLRYFRMDAYKDDIIDDLTTASIDTGIGMKIYNHKVINVQQAPMPFTTVRTGTFATAINDTSKDIRGLDATELDYSIIQVKHNITETANSTDLAMFIDSGITVNMTNDTKLQNDWYLKLDGKIDLVGKSQLVQTTNSDLDITSEGFIERDQNGESNKFNYNYWSSPVSSINNTTINHGFTVAGVMKDGTTTTPQNLNWTTSLNSSATSPITLSSRWIYKFQDLSNAYANWATVGQNGSLLAGQGYTMKGSNAATSNQNYTFVGKPNNGTITSTVSANNLNLCGNPYASAIDADKFIEDNKTSITGTLRFWEHYDTNTSHNTVQYQGGYATYSKVGGTPPVAPAGISGLGYSNKTPKRFIPVGQGFFVTGSSTGGTITFNNGQRLFVKEDHASSYNLFRNSTNSTVTSDNANYNNNDSYSNDEFMKLRLGYISADNYHRQILLGFMNQYASASFDNGYDALSNETLTNDMYFMNGTDKLNIQGDGYFNVNNIYPLVVKNATAGKVKFKIDDKENFDQDQEIYIHDNETGQYHSIKSQDFEISLPTGITENRFSLRFTSSSSSLGIDDKETLNEILIAHAQSNNVITIKNEKNDNTIKSVMLHNLVGQQITTWKIDNSDQTKIELQLTDISTGAYIVKVITEKGDISKKILVK